MDLGRYREGATIERQVVLKNPGKKDLQIKNLQGNCACITAVADNKVIKPGDSTVVKIVFKPQNRGGTQQKALRVRVRSTAMRAILPFSASAVTKLGC